MSLEKIVILKSELELVQYPGMVKNVNKMIDTLGDMKKISMAFASEERKLEIRYHPTNPFNKGSIAESGKNFGVLLSIKIRRKKNSPKETPPIYQVDVVGHCTRMFCFNNLNDFQYLPVTSHAAQRSLLKSIVPQSITQLDYFDHENVPIFVCPRVFARSDTVNLNNLRMSNLLEDGQQEQLGLLHRSSYDNRRNIVFNMVDTLPTEPDVKIMKRMKIKYVTDEQLQIVTNLFERCPIWTRVALLYESGLSNEKLKYITPSLAYYFSTGPWRTLYVRYGHDPRRDFESRYYQTFYYRLRFRSGMVSFVSNRSHKKKLSHSIEQDGGYLQQDIDYPYLDEKKLPRCRQCILRYSDIHIPKVQEMLDKIPKPIMGAVCNERTGWLPLGFDVEVRRIVNTSIKELLRSACRKINIDAEYDDMVDGKDNDDVESCDGDDDDEIDADRGEEFNDEASIDNDDDLENMLEMLESA